MAYGLCVQALDRAQLRTNLLPEEIITTRLVKAKKPWAVAAVALLLVGLTINYFGHYSSRMTADKDDPAMEQAITAAGTAWQTQAEHLATEHTDADREVRRDHQDRRTTCRATSTAGCCGSRC